MTTTKLIMGITYGDATGIGPELVAKALQSEEVRSLATWVLIGDERVFKAGQYTAGQTYACRKIGSPADIADQDEIYLIDLANQDPSSVVLGAMSPDSGRVCGETLKEALRLAQEQQLDGVVYAPLNKEALHRGGFEFHDELQFFASLLNCKEGFSEINVMGDLWVTRVTSHVPLHEVSKLITKEKVGSIIRFAHETLKGAGIPNPRIAVAALNPHAGDGGLMGMEEISEIRPAIQEKKEEGIRVEGPYPADTIFLRLKTNPFDCLVGMYHDQAQTGMKLMGFNRGVTVGGGLPAVLTTPAHGTAFDIAGQGKADPGAMISALQVAVKLAKAKRV
jgi:4-hydroxythreonine-4-phosphate dehydrogenase